MDIKNIKVSLLVFFGLLLLGYAVFSMAEENSNSTMNVALDSDQDGLSDEEEKTYGTNPNKTDTDSDGYGDGAEVQSGYDPLKPAPGDKIVDETKEVETPETKNGDIEKSDKVKDKVNLTKEISTQVANMFSNKSSSEEEISIDDLDAVIQKTTEGGTSFDSLPDISDDQIKINKIKCNSLTDEECDQKKNEAATEYLTSVSYIIFNHSPKEIKNEEGVEFLFEEIINNLSLFTSGTTDKSYFDDFSNRAKDILKELEKTEVPENMIEIHKKGMKIATYGITLNEDMEIDKNDPINNIVSLGKMRDFIGLMMEYVESTSAEFVKLGIEEVSIFK